jgi:hypothetical protein
MSSVWRGAVPVSIHGGGDPATASSVAAMPPPDPLVARLRAAGCVFAEDEVAL